MPKEHKRLGDLLLEEKLITPEDLSAAVAEQRKTGQLLGATLIQLGVVREEALLQSLQRQLGLPLVDLASVEIDESTVALVKEEVAKKYLALPIAVEGRSTLVVAMADPLNVAAIEDLRFHSGMFIKPVLSSQSALSDAIDKYYHLDRSVDEVLKSIVSDGDELLISQVREEEQPEAVDALLKEAEGRPIVRLTNWILARAVEDRASDIHLEPQHHEMVVRLRIDGLLQEVQRLPKWTQSAIVSRIKVLSNLDIAEKRLPQDGRMMIEVGGRRVDMRVSTLPVTNGEKVVIRVVDQARNSLDLTEIGFYPDDLARAKRYCERPQGIILVTGPTGSGKSTLLYAALRYIQHETKNIVTVEDPVEYQIPGLNQVQVDEKAKKTFATALRAILRQDPDVIMVGEIRDLETAQIAFRASVTGHLVLSTIHTNDASSAVTRLVDLGLQPFMVASSLLGVISMRLVRTLCPRCKESYEASASNLDRLGAAGRAEGTITLWRGRGCPHCRQTGYHGRTGIFEVLEIDESIRKQISAGATDAVIRGAAVEAGMRSIGEDGLKKVMEGKTTLEEVTRVIYLADASARICPSCSAVLNHDFEYCPSCGGWVGEHCEGCRRRLNTGWTYCPFCGKSASTPREAQVLPHPGRDRRQKRTRLEVAADEPVRKAS
jgi:type IV pilus assembly protein PilB